MTLLAIVAGLTWLWRRIAPSGIGSGALRRGYAFSVEFRDGRSQRVEGVVPRAVYNAFEDVASLSRVNGRVIAQRDGSLGFSAEVPEGVRQQFRNAWWAGKP